MHRPVRKMFLRNPCTVSNLMDVLECDILDMQSLAKYKDTYRYIPTVICFLEISASGSHKDKERPCSQLGFWIPIS